MYDNIVNQAVFISRASEGSISTDWIMNQPVHIRLKYVESFTDELKERKAKMEASKR